MKRFIDFEQAKKEYNDFIKYEPEDAIVYSHKFDNYIYALESKVKKLEHQKAEILKDIKELAQSETCTYAELDAVLQKYSEAKK